MSVSIKPLEDRILVQTLDAEQTTASGLVIPDTAKEKPQEGKVLAVGPGRFDEDGDKRVPLDISVGDVVIYSKYGGTEVKYNNEDYLILSARDHCCLTWTSACREPRTPHGAGAHVLSRPKAPPEHPRSARTAR